MANSGLAEIQKQVTHIWRGLGRPQQITVALMGLASLGLIVGLLTWARNPDYATVFSGLSEEDAAAVVAKLKESKTPYELDNGGTLIRVPASQLYETRLQLASAGLPQGGGVGFEIFNQTNFGMTDFVQKVNYQRALEGELSRTINHLAPVEQSRVHIVVPQPTLYTDSQKEATASVVLTLKPGQRIKDAQILGIARLISSSVEGLKLENVTIVDAGGNVLSGSQAGNRDPYRINSSQMDSQRAFEADLEQRVQGMLDRVIGNGKATVRARAMFDWDQFESTSEIYSPGNRSPQVRSARESVERYPDGQAETGGAPGTRTNMPGLGGLISSTVSVGPLERRDTTTNYELSKTMERLSKTSASIKKLSVAVVLDGAKEIDAAQMEEVSRLVSAAAGIDASRGDVLVVSSIPYHKDVPITDLSSMEEARRWEQYLQAGKIAAMVLGPLLLVVLLLLTTRRARRYGTYSIQEVPAGKQQAELAGREAVAALGRAMARPAPAMPQLTADDTQERLVRDQVTMLARTKPEVMAELIKTWLEEDGSYNGSAVSR